jgi:hypothetical protein
MELWTAVLTGGVAAALVSGIFSIVLWKMNRKATKEDKADDTKVALRILLYDRIKHLGRDYINRGEISSEDLEDIISMHKVYHDNLNGNGFLDSIMAQVKNLPIHN